MSNWDLDDIERCFGGAIPAILTTASPDGVPNIMYLSRAHKVDDQRIALSNQFMSKSARNLAANPRADLLLLDPHTHDEYRLTLQYERTDRRGHVFDRLRADIESLAALVGMQDVFRLRAADIFRVLSIEAVPHKTTGADAGFHSIARAPTAEVSGLAELARRLGRAPDLDILVDTASRSLDELFGYSPHDDAAARRAGPDAVHGRQPRLRRGERRAPRCRSVKARSASPPSVARSSRVDGISQLREVLRVDPARVRGQRRARGARSRCQASTSPRAGSSYPRSRSANWSACSSSRAERIAAFDVVDDHVLDVRRLAGGERRRQRVRDRGRAGRAGRGTPRARDVGRRTGSGHGSVACATSQSDASTFFDGDYLIKGVAGRILWSLLSPARRHRPHRVHQPGTAARSDARAARLQGQPREPAVAAQATTRRTRRAGQDREDVAGQVPHPGHSAGPARVCFLGPPGRFHERV